MVAWMIVYFSNGFYDIKHITVSQWHAHEMLYGYAMSVVAGFLLTAVKNWTDIPTLYGIPLAGMFATWAVARALLLFGTTFLPLAASLDLLFNLMLIVFITIPIIKSKQWMQLAVVAKVTLLFIGNIVFFLGYFGLLANGMLFAINGAVLLYIGLILMIGRRIIPFFIERGTAVKVKLRQYKWLDISILSTFFVLFLNVIFLKYPYLTALLAWALFILNGLRLCNWYTAGILQMPLLWSLYISAWIINFGFMFLGLQAKNSNLSILTLHTFTIGGIGLITLSMMSRVALGHTGRDIKELSPWMTLAFTCLILSLIFRVFLPMFMMQFYSIWILISAAFWILGFVIFVVIYAPILSKSRVDGVFG